MHNLTFKPITPATRNRLRRGHVVKLTGSDTPMMVTRADYRRGVKLVPYEGDRLASRPLARSRRESTREAVPFTPFAQVAQIAVKS